MMRNQDSIPGVGSFISPILIIKGRRRYSFSFITNLSSAVLYHDSFRTIDFWRPGTWPVFTMAGSTCLVFQREAASWDCFSAVPLVVA
jgi:hypothetical protein